MNRNQIGLVPSIYTNPNAGSITVPAADNVDQVQTKVFVLSLGVISFVFSQVLRSLLATDEAP